MTSRSQLVEFDVRQHNAIFISGVYRNAAQCYLNDVTRTTHSNVYTETGRRHGSLTYSSPNAAKRVLRQASPIHAHHPASAKHGEADGHPDAVLYDVELAAADLVPLDGDLGDLDAGGAADDGAVGAEHGHGGGRLGEHEHLDVEDPALGVHVGHDVGQGGAREELEAALRVAHAARGGGRQDREHEVERAHEEVAQGRALDDGGAADEVGAAADGDAAVRAVDDLLAALDEPAEVAEAGGAVGVGEEHVGAARVAQAVGHAAALAAVRLERHDAQDVVQAVLARELQRHVDGAVAAAVVDDEDLVAREVVARRVLGVEVAARGRRARRGSLSTAAAAVWLQVGVPGGAAVLLVEVLDGFLEGRQDSVLLVVRWEHDGYQHLGRLNDSSVGNGSGGAVIPASLQLFASATFG